MKFLGSLFLLLLSAVGHAQVFPVQGNLQIAPPYSPFLTDYTAPGTQKLALQLRSNDIDLGDHPIRFRLTIEGAGIAIRTKPNYVPPSPYTLAGDGALSIFYGEDLLDYFNPDRLDFAGFSPREFRQSGKLPEGLYQFSFEVFDYYRQIALSHKITLAVWIVLNDPPLLNLPRHNTTVALLDPVNVAFAWTPRHSSSPNAAAGSEYVFKLVEIWPADRNPYDAFLTQPPLYETVVSEPQLLYGPAEPALIPGRKYAWQVQARDENGRDIFKNQGKSEVYAFQFGDALSAPENVRKEGNSHQAIALLWEMPSKGETPAQYNIRHKAVSAARWQETFTDKQWVALSGLLPGTDYEVQVRSKRDDRYSDYSNLLRLKTAESPAEFVCGQPPPPRKPTDKTTRLLRLRTGDSVACNDWRIVVTEITKSSIGEYSGKGMMPVKMFNGANIKVTFHGVVNADYQLITGGVESVYDKDSPMALAVEEMKKIGEHKESLPAAPIDTAAVSVISFPGTIDSVYFDKEKKEAVVIDAEGKRTSFPQKTNPATREAKSMQITDAAGNTVIVDKDGTVSRGVNGGGGAGGGNAGGQGIAAGNWFKNIMDFLNRYKGNETDKRQAIAWHNKMDSTVTALSKRADVPDNLMKAMLDARQDAKPAWANLEKGADGIRPRGPSADFDDGFTAEDVALCKKNAETAAAVEKYLSLPKPKVNCVSGGAGLGKIFKAPDGSNVALGDSDAPLAFFAKEEGELFGRLVSFKRNDIIYIYNYRRNDQQFAGTWQVYNSTNYSDENITLNKSNKEGTLVKLEASGACPEYFTYYYMTENVQVVGGKGGDAYLSELAEEAGKGYQEDPVLVSANTSHLYDYAKAVGSEEAKKITEELTRSAGSTSINQKIFFTDFNTPAGKKREIEIYFNSLSQGIAVWIDFDKNKKPAVKIKAGSSIQNANAAETNKFIAKLAEILPGCKQEGDGNPLTLLLDGIAGLIGQATIDEKYYNPDDKKYNPFPSKVFGIVQSAGMSELPGAPSHEDGYNPPYTQPRCGFALICGVYNGIVEIAGAVPAVTSLLAKLTVNENHALDTLLKKAAEIKWDSIPSYMGDLWGKYNSANPCKKKYFHGKAISFVASCLVGAGEWRAALKATKGGIRAGKYTITKTVSNNLATRPYINSPSTITNIIKSGKGVPDAFFKGGINYKVPGTFNGSNGIFELGINPETNTIYHFLFKTVK